MQANAQHLKMHTKLLVFHALIALTIADVSHISREYLPPVTANKHVTHDQQIDTQQQQQYQQVQHDEVLSDEAANGNAHALTDVQQSLKSEFDTAVPVDSTSDGKSASDPFIQPGSGGFPTYPGQGFPYPGYPGQFPGQGFPGVGFPGTGFPGAGFPGQGFPGQFFPGQGSPYPGYPGQFPGQGFPGQGFPGAGFPGGGFPGQGFPGQGLPAQGFAGPGFPGQGYTIQGFPPQAGGFPGIPYQTGNQQQPSGSNASPSSGFNERGQTARIASDTIYDANGGYVYDKPK